MTGEKLELFLIRILADCSSCLKAPPESDHLEQSEDGRSDDPR
jgi:hypothetical protein